MSILSMHFIRQPRPFGHFCASILESHSRIPSRSFPLLVMDADRRKREAREARNRMRRRRSELNVPADASEEERELARITLRIDSLRKKQRKLRQLQLGDWISHAYLPQSPSYEATAS